MIESASILVNAENPYNIRIGRGVLSEIVSPLSRAAKTAIIHPSVLTRAARAVAEFAPGPVLIEVPDGEDAKTARVADTCWHRLASAGFTRSDAVIGLGGGSTTDLAGFVAATWLRGVDYIAIPTTVLGMADAAVGGKAGINIPEGKNLVGAFHEPVCVVCDLDLLAGLPRDEVRSGLAEVIKCGFIADQTILALAGTSASSLVDTSTQVFAQCLQSAIRVKAGVVSADLRERGGTCGIGREALNYGHTLAHAIEKVEGYSWRHGEAVAIGMVFAAEIAWRLGMVNDQEVGLHRHLLEACGLPVSYDRTGWDRLRPSMSLDKKARGNRLRLVLLDGIGHPTIEEDISEALLAEAYHAIGSV